MRRPTLVAVLVLIHGLESSLLTVTPPIGTSSVAFVFDVTGSMHDDLLQVMQGATHIYNATLRREYAIYDYILIPFADPGKTQRRQRTTVSTLNASQMSDQY